MAKHHILVDACVAAAHFAPKTTASANLKARSAALMMGRATSYDVRLLIPSFCIAEVFAVFEKYRWGRTWNKQVSAANALTPTEFQLAREYFRDAIHNGSVLLQWDVNRYHILCVDLIAPVNNAYKILRSRKKKRTPSPASTYDMLIVAMGIWLQHQLGPDDFTLVTGDDRIRQVVSRARSTSLNNAIRGHLQDIAESLGLRYGPALYPSVVNLVNAKRSEIEARLPDWFPAWP
jgi:hypothetical protein